MICDGATRIFAPGATLNNGNVLMVGFDGVGTLLAEGSGSTHSVINSAHAYLGMEDEGAGTVTINDAIWRNSGNFYIGMDGTATVNVVDGGSVAVGGGLCLGIDPGSSGVLNIASGGSVVSTGAIRVGVGGAVADKRRHRGRSALGSGGSLTGDQMLAVGKGSQIELAGGSVTGGVVGSSIDILAGGVIFGYGTLAAPDGVAITDNGIIRASGGTLAVHGNLFGSGAIQLGADSTAVFTGSSLNLASIASIGSGCDAVTGARGGRDGRYFRLRDR